jgi:hypothetical protein
VASGRTARGAIALGLALVVGGGLGFGLHVADQKGLLPVKIGPDRATAEAAAPSAGTSAGTPAASASSAPASPASSAAPSASASASAPPSAEATPGACMRALFPEDTFASEPDLPFVCEESAAATAVTQLKTRIVVEGRGRAATGGMKEWAVLGFYEVAGLSLLRGRCCPSAPPLTVADADPCKLAEAVNAVGEASKPGAPKADLDAAVKQFDGEVRCLMKIQQTKRFGYDPLLGGEASTFAKTTARLGGTAGQ